MNIEVPLKRIECAFNNVPIASTSMRQYHYTDLYAFDGDFNPKDYKSLEEIRIDTSWLDIENSEIEECLCQLGHMNAEDYLYFLPAYLTYAIKSIDNPKLESDILASVVFHLTSPKDEFISLLSNEQVNTLINSLEYMQQNSHFLLTKDIKLALNKWFEIEKN